MSLAEAGERTWIDVRADRFERDWKRGGERPRIEDVLGDEPGPRRAPLLQELIRVERELRLIAGEKPGAEEYLQRFPDDRAAVEAAFGIAERGDPPPPGPPATAAHSLLFGLLALQNNFIDRDTLLAAFNAWIADKSRSLGRILLDRGALSPARHALLTELVQEHLAHHGQDPERSLAVLAVVPAVRAGLEGLPDLDVQASLLYLGATTTEGGAAGAEATASWEDDSATVDAEGRFCIVRFHDRGALGEVYIARDQQLHRIVALKRIQSSHAVDREKCARFVVEAEITGRLEHPGIVPVYGLGHYDDGRPFYAMRFIRGDNLKAAIDQFHREDEGRTSGARVLALQKLLRRFLDVCDAIDYAHSRGVLHRDLKPGNIMLGKFGETLVVDWGLAKTTGRPGAVTTATLDDRTLIPQSGSDLRGTELGARLGTPAYMSPEQAAGRIDELGPASDVYSLGATLYCLLTGRAPFNEPDMPELLRQVERGEFPPPRRIKGWIDPALEAICMKAMATDPARRYRSTRILADDVEHWLADEPVSAWREPWSRGLHRRLKRHRTAVAGVGAAMLAALLGLGAVSAVQALANGRLERANSALYAANAQLSAAKDVITRSNEELRASRDREHQRFNLAMNAIKLFHGEVSQDLLLKERDFEKLRTRLLRGAADFYTQLEALLKNQPDAASRAELARAYDELGEVIEKIGAKPHALAMRRQGIALRRELLAESRVSPDAELGMELARSLIASADLQSQTGDKAGATAALEEARGLAEAAASSGPASDGARLALGLALRQSADLLWNEGKRDDARARLARARTIFQSLAEAKPAMIGHQVDLAACDRMLGTWLGFYNPEHPHEALAANERALAVLQHLAEAHPEDLDLQADLAEGLWTTGGDLGTLGRADEGLKLLQGSRAVWRRLADANPAVTSFREREARVLNGIGIALVVSGRYAEAELVYRDAVVRFQKLTSAHPDDVRPRVGLGYVYNNLGCALRDLGRLAEALAEFRRGAEVFRTLADAHPDEPSYRNDQISRQFLMSDTLRKLGRPGEALDLDRQSLDMAEGLGEHNPEPDVLVATLSSMALSLSESGDVAAAVAAARRAVGRADKLPRDSAYSCYTAALAHAVHWIVCGRAGSGVLAADREPEGRTAMALFRRSTELGLHPSNLSMIPEPFQHRADFRLLLMDLKMPHDPFGPIENDRQARQSGGK